MEKPINQQKRDYLEKIYKRHWEDHKSTHQRFDYLLVTIAGAGIYLSLELVKYLLESGLSIPPLLKVSGIILAISILANIFSQFCSFNVHHNSLRIEYFLVFEKNDKLKSCDRKVKIYQFLNSFFMWICMISMLLGTVGLIFFLSITF